MEQSARSSETDEVVCGVGPTLGAGLMLVVTAAESISLGTGLVVAK
jgi:hypothetical protein